MSRRSSALQPAEFNPPVGQSSTTTSSALQKVCCRPQASIPTLNRLIDASPAYQHGVLLPRRHAVELREHRPRQRLAVGTADDLFAARDRSSRASRASAPGRGRPGARVWRHREPPAAPRRVRAVSARPGGGPRSCRGRPACWVRLLVAAMLAASVFFTAENFTVNKLFTPRV